MSRTLVVGQDGRKWALVAGGIGRRKPGGEFMFGVWVVPGGEQPGRPMLVSSPMSERDAENAAKAFAATHGLAVSLER